MVTGTDRRAVRGSFRSWRVGPVKGGDHSGLEAGGLVQLLQHLGAGKPALRLNSKSQTTHAHHESTLIRIIVYESLFFARLSAVRAYPFVCNTTFLSPQSSPRPPRDSFAAPHRPVSPVAGRSCTRNSFLPARKEHTYTTTPHQTQSCSTSIQDDQELFLVTVAVFASDADSPCGAFTIFNHSFRLICTADASANRPSLFHTGPRVLRLDHRSRKEHTAYSDHIIQPNKYSALLSPLHRSAGDRTL